MAESFKVEPSVKAEVKDEPSASPPAFEDDDLYEDAGDLNFYDPNGPADFNNVSLMRVSNDLWKRWSDLNDDQEVQIGTMRVWEEPVTVGNVTKNVVSGSERAVAAPNSHQLNDFLRLQTRRKMLLDPKFPQHQEVAREYNLTTNDVFDARGSQFVFSEEDLRGFKEKSRNTGLPLSVLRARSERVDKPKWDRNRNKNQVYYRKAIPSKLPPPAPAPIAPLAC